MRGVANAEITPELVLALGRAAARVLGPESPTFCLGRDTRRSGPLLQAALAAGLAAEGAEVLDMGVLPTPALAFHAARHGWSAAVVSASHNPFADNGIKFFAPGGRKLADATEERLEDELRTVLASPDAADRPTGAAVGWVVPRPGAGEYADALLDQVGDGRLEGVRLVLDCAHGAASGVAPDVFRRAGATVTVLHAEPDGRNINDGCGSTHPERLRHEVVATGADAGLAFDGDADRVLCVDAGGALVDGDQMIALCAVDRKASGRLPGETVVVTVMANLGFREAMAAHGIRVEETPVGDRHVLARLEEGGWALGGEQSGHVIHRDLATTGDGLLTGLQVLEVMARTGRPLAELAAVMTRRPQALRSIAVADRDALATAAGLWREVRAVEEGLDGRGRVLVRPSGTEAVVRVMVEAHTIDDAEAACARLVAAVRAELGDGSAPAPR